jgi:hypothetical protein
MSVPVLTWIQALITEIGPVDLSKVPPPVDHLTGSRVAAAPGSRSPDRLPSECPRPSPAAHSRGSTCSRSGSHHQPPARSQRVRSARPGRVTSPACAGPPGAPPASSSASVRMADLSSWRRPGNSVWRLDRATGLQSVGSRVAHTRPRAHGCSIGSIRVGCWGLNNAGNSESRGKHIGRKLFKSADLYWEVGRGQVSSGRGHPTSKRGDL